MAKESREFEDDSDLNKGLEHYAILQRCIWIINVVILNIWMIKRQRDVNIITKYPY